MYLCYCSFINLDKFCNSCLYLYIWVLNIYLWVLKRILRVIRCIPCTNVITCDSFFLEYYEWRGVTRLINSSQRVRTRERYARPRVAREQAWTLRRSYARASLSASCSRESFLDRSRRRIPRERERNW